MELGNVHHEGVGPSARSIPGESSHHFFPINLIVWFGSPSPSGCCSLTKYGHPVKNAAGEKKMMELESTAAGRSSSCLPAKMRRCLGGKHLAVAKRASVDSI